MSRRDRMVLGCIVGAGALAAIVVVATNGLSFGSAPSTRTKVSNYIAAVNLVEKQMGIEIGHVMSAYRAYASKAGGSPATVSALGTSAGTFRKLQQRISAVSAPPEAAKLGRLLSQLLTAEEGAAVEVKRLAAFTPAFHTVSVQVQLLSVQLSRALTSVPQPKAHQIKGTPQQIAQARAAFAKASATAASAQADAIDQYDAALGRVLLRLRAIVPPAVMLPAFRAEAATLAKTKKAGAALAAGLRKGNRTNVSTLGRRFDLAARTSAAVSRQRAEIAAVKAYNAKVRRIGSLEEAVLKETSRLSNTLQ